MGYPVNHWQEELAKHMMQRTRKNSIEVCIQASPSLSSTAPPANGRKTC